MCKEKIDEKIKEIDIQITKDKNTLNEFEQILKEFKNHAENQIENINSKLKKYHQENEEFQKHIRNSFKSINKKIEETVDKMELALEKQRRITRVAVAPLYIIMFVLAYLIIR